MNGRSALSRTECLDLMASVPVGRLVYTYRALPAVIPLRFFMDGEGVVVHTGTDSTLNAAVRDTVVAFQVDDLDPVTLAGWSVTLVGQARLVTGPAEIARRSSIRSPQMQGTNGHLARISVGFVSGSRLSAAASEEVS